MNCTMLVYQFQESVVNYLFSRSLAHDHRKAPVAAHTSEPDSPPLFTYRIVRRQTYLSTLTLFGRINIAITPV